jgi:hypothetical protein
MIGHLALDFRFVTKKGLRESIPQPLFVIVATPGAGNEVQFKQEGIKADERKRHSEVV